MCPFSNLLRTWLDAQGISAMQAAPSFGVSHQTVYNWLSKTHQPPHTRRPLIARVLGISEAELEQAIEAELEQIMHASEASQDGAA